MPEFVLSAIGQFFSVNVLLMMLLGTAVGLIFGLVPGLSGLTALAVLIPFVFGMAPMAGLAFLLAAHAVTYTGGSITAILLGIPGTAPNAATIADGYALSRQGRAGEAIGAALFSSGLGGLIGVIVLVALLPFLQPIVEAFGLPETFFLALFGILLIGALGEGQHIKGVIAGLLGIFLSCIGEQAITGIPRFWLGFTYFLDGIHVVVPALGLFAIPEIVTLMTSGRSIAQSGNAQNIQWSNVAEGISATLRHKFLLLKSSMIGVLIGIIPGVGGETSPFVAYIAARQSSVRSGEFGTGMIEGVIAPESSNNAKEGGSLVPTLAFGIPGSAAMALLLGAFLILGLQPGPGFLREHMDIAFGLALVIAVSNLVAMIFLLAITRQLTALTYLDGRILGIVLLSLIVFGAYAARNEPYDVVFAFAFGLLGYFMQRLRYSRAALLLGYVLGPAVETYLHLSLASYGPWFFLRPISLTIVALTILTLLWPTLRRIRSR